MNSLFLILIIITSLILVFMVSLLFLAYKFFNQNNTTKNKNSIESLNDLKQSMNDLKEAQIQSRSVLETKMQNYSDAFNNFKQKEFFNNNFQLHEKMSKLSQNHNSTFESLKTIESQTSNINDIFLNTNKKGYYGEISLSKILKDLYGANNKLITYQKATNSIDGDKNIRPDFIIKTNINKNYQIIIDSKFPLKSFQNYQKNKNDITKKEFIKSVKSCIVNITKYKKAAINSSLIMYIPSDYLALEIFNGSFDKIVEFSQKNNVCICGPSNVLYILNLFSSFIETENQKNNLDQTIQKINAYIEKIKTLVEYSQLFLLKLSKIQKDYEQTIHKTINDIQKITNHLDKTN